MLDYVRLCIDATQPTIIIKGVMKNDPIYAARRESLPFSNGMRFQMCDPNTGKSSITSSINGTLPWDYLIEKTEHIKSTMIGKYWGNRLWLFNW